MNTRKHLQNYEFISIYLIYFCCPRYKTTPPIQDISMLYIFFEFWVCVATFLLVFLFTLDDIIVNREIFYLLGLACIFKHQIYVWNGIRLEKMFRNKVIDKRNESEGFHDARNWYIIIPYCIKWWHTKENFFIWIVFYVEKLFFSFVKLNINWNIHQWGKE